MHGSRGGYEFATLLLLVLTGCAMGDTELHLQADGDGGGNDDVGDFGTDDGGSDDGPGDDDGVSSVCGDGMLTGEEVCDGELFGPDRTCADVGLGSSDEQLACTPECKLDFSRCSSCGDGQVEAPEACEPGTEQSDPDLQGMTCMSLGFEGGQLDCSVSCVFDEASCFSCGDGNKNGNEACDGDALGGLTCAQLTSPLGVLYEGGELACTEDCELDESDCSVCGDGKITGDEVCDGAALGGESCATLGATTGPLACASDCGAFDTTGCTTCGDGMVEGSEQCDGANLGGQSCTGLGFLGGSLSCASTCTFDTVSCTGSTCGDAMITGNEKCDCGSIASGCTVSELDGKGCGDLQAPNGQPYSGGSLSCNSPATCTFDASACLYCGDGQVSGSEDCDGADLQGETCSSQGFVGGGVLACSSSCGYDTSGCLNTELLATVLNTEDFADSALKLTGSQVGIDIDEPDAEPWALRIWVPSDLTQFALSLSPNYAFDRPSATLCDGDTFPCTNIVATCAAPSSGAPCDFGTNINLSGHKGRILTAFVEAQGSTFVSGFTISISGRTAGVQSGAPVTLDATWRSGFSFDDADYFLWPVSSSTGNLAYTWDDFGLTGTNPRYAIGVMRADGRYFAENDTTDPSTGSWPVGPTPTGWWMMGTSAGTSVSTGKPYKFVVAP